MRPTANHIPLKLLQSSTKSEKCDDLLLFTKIRDEKIRLPYFLEYYRALGIDRFFFVDNGSTDGTIEYLIQQQDVSTYSTSEKLDKHDTWIQFLLTQHSVDHWSLVVDADELMVYPFSSLINLKGLSRFLEHKKHNGIRSTLIDMYGNGAIASTQLKEHQNPIEVCPFFDGDSYQTTLSRIGPQRTEIVLSGGPRDRVFSCQPYLLKVPFFRFDPSMKFGPGAHAVENARTYVFGALLHFKFLSIMLPKTANATEEKQFWKGSMEYKKYQEVFATEENVNLYYPNSLKYKNWLSLFNAGLMRFPISYGLFALKRLFQRVVLRKNRDERISRS